jgi:hypothetical protein
MRLFRIRADLNWRYALGELSLIVVGVLIALAANSWWAERGERHRERAYLRQLLTDVRETEVRLNGSIRVDSVNLASVRRVLDTAEAFHQSGGSAVPSADSLEIVTAYSSFAPMSGTYSALLQSGGTQILRNDSLRFHIIAYAATMAVAQEVLRQTEAQTWRNSEMVNLQIWKNVMQPSGNRRWRERIDVETLLQDPGFLNTMTMQRQAGENRLGVLQRLREPVTQLRHLLELELRVRDHE